LKHDHAMKQPLISIPALKIHVRALRLPFTAASVLPFLAGLHVADGSLCSVVGILALLAVAAAHLSCNLINDYADSRSGVDWKDTTYFDGIFGGSKLIQAGVLPENHYFQLAIGFGVLCLGSGIVAGLLVDSVLFPLGCLVALLLGWAYSMPPATLAYRRWGEPVIFLLFGPAPVFAGWLVASGTLPGPAAIMVAMPFGLLTTAILVANEIPDHPQDSASGKDNWVGWIGVRHAHRLYAIFMLSATVFILLGWLAGVFSGIAVTAVVVILPATFRAELIMMHSSHRKERLIVASKITILAQLLAGLFIVLGVAS
jgi:1,4-dihydroxy-2-naphthoate octaprenyltransferase